MKHHPPIRILKAYMNISPFHTEFHISPKPEIRPIIFVKLAVSDSVTACTIATSIIHYNLISVQPRRSTRSSSRHPC